MFTHHETYDYTYGIGAMKNFDLSARHIAGKLNTVADYISHLSLQKVWKSAHQAETYPQTCPSPKEIIWR